MKTQIWQGFSLMSNLESEQAHRDQPHPGVEAVEVGDRRGVAVLVDPEVVRVEDGDKPEGDAGRGQQVEHGVQQLSPDASAAPARSVHEHG